MELTVQKQVRPWGASATSDLKAVFPTSYLNTGAFCYDLVIFIHCKSQNNCAAEKSRTGSLQFQNMLQSYVVIDTSGAGVSTDTQINRRERKNELSHLWPTDSQWGSG